MRFTPPRRIALVTAAVILFVGLPPAGAAAPPIVAIRFEGNDSTRPGTMLREMVVGPGDPAEPEPVERSRQAIMDLELFRSVEAELQPDPAGVVLVIRVVEKRYSFLLPSLNRSSDGDVSYGGAGTLNNLWGRDHRFRLEVERTNAASDSDVDDETSFGLEYRYPRVGGGPWQLDATVDVEEAEVTEDLGDGPGRYLRDLGRVGLVGSRWLARTGPSRGWRFGLGVNYEDFAFEFLEGDPNLYFDTTELGLLMRAEFIDVHVFEFNRAGRSMSYELRAYSKDVVSARDRLLHAARYRRYLPVTRRRHTNLNVQFRAALSTESLFGGPTYSITGSSALRGYERDAIEGDAYWLVNVEFLTPIARPNTLRGVVFVDVGDAAGDPEGLLPLRPDAGAGLGLRWKIRALVRVDLRVDVGYGFDRTTGGTTKVYAGTDVTF